jgi:hypothetical protein
MVITPTGVDLLSELLCSYARRLLEIDVLYLLESLKLQCKGCSNKNARFKVRTIVGLLGWRLWKFNICHLSLLRLVVMERYTKEQRVIVVKTHYKCGESYVETVRKVSSHAMVIRIGHRGRVIWHRATSFFGGLWNLVSMPTNHKQFLSSRRRFDVPLAKLSRNYVEMASRISSKERVCQQSRGGRLSDIVFHN